MKKQVAFALSFVASVFSFGLVSAASALDSASFVRDFLGAFINSVPEMALVKWLFFLLVLIIIYSITEVLPFFGEKSWLSGLFSIIVALLAVFFLDSQQIYTSLASYKAFGVTITAIVPFILLSYISLQCYKKNQVFFSKVMWILFIVTLLWTSLDGFVSDAPQQEGSFGLVYPIVLALAVLMLFLEDSIMALLMRSQIKGKLASAEARADREALLEILSLQEELGKATDPEKIKILREKIAELRKAKKL